MFRNIAYFLILGQPLIIYLGFLTLIAFILTAAIGFVNFRGPRKIPYKWHPTMAIISIVLAVIHGLLGILARFG